MSLSDSRLQSRVEDALGWEPSVDAAHIGVTAQDGVVTLSGFVGSLAEKVAAEQAARRVKGVRAIAEEIEVRLPWRRSAPTTRSPGACWISWTGISPSLMRP